MRTECYKFSLPLQAFLKWADSQHPKNGDRLIRALTYLQNCRPYIMNYLEDGNCSICNGLSENSIRPLVVGRKAWLFSNSQDGANASMTVFSIVETAKANELDPQKYLEFLLEHRPNKELTDAEMEHLMPWSKEAIQHCKE
ncbi:MAG: transposase [Lachnospiraceae bacterium]|nr:transposase [Lachnospiraceae bacterium]